MKKPTSLYLNELQVNRVARRLEKALDGHGSLSGFFTWIEERAYAALMEGGEYKDPSSEPIWRHYFNAIDRWYRQGEEQAMATYRQAWEQVEKRLPWHRENPAASHVLALFLLRQTSRPLWDRPRSVKAPLNPLIGILIETTDQILADFKLTAQRSSAKQGERGLLWLSDRVEEVREPRARPVSFYFHEQAHAMMLRAFQGTFFDRLLGALDELLSGWGFEVAGLEPEARFLEHPMTFFQRWPLEIPPVVMLNTLALYRLAETPEDERWLDELHESHYIQEWEYKRGHYFGGGYSWEALVRLAERFGRERMRQASLEMFKEDLDGYSFDGHDFYYGLSFHLAFRLGLIDPANPQNKPTPEQVLGAFMSRYGLSELKPERRLMYRVLRHLFPSPNDNPTDPVQYHALGLLQAYALEVLPEDEREPERVSHTVLGLLGQTHLFPTRDTLEAWSGMRVRVDSSGRWRLYKGRKLWRELSEEQAFEVASLLKDVALPLNGKERNMPHRWEEQFDPYEKTPRAAHRLGPVAIEAALEALAAPTPYEGEGPRLEAERQTYRIELLKSRLQKDALSRSE